MTYKVDGIYSNPDGFWESNEYFVKQGEIRMIDGKLHKLGWSVLITRAWYPISTTDYDAIHECITARCVLKKKPTQVRESK